MRITRQGLSTLEKFGPTCTEKSAMMTGVKRLIVKPEDEVVFKLAPFAALVRSAGKEEIDEMVIIRYFSGLEHFTQIEREGTIIASEIPKKWCSFLHMALPLEDGYYQNEGVRVEIRNQILIGGNGEGQTWSHLAGKFVLPETEKLAKEVKKIQAQIPDFLEIARDIEKSGGIDFKNYPGLLSETDKAIRTLK